MSSETNSNELFSHLQVLTRSQNRRISSVFSDSEIVNTPVAVTLKCDKELTAGGKSCALLLLSARSVESLIDLTASGDGSNNKIRYNRSGTKQTVIKHHNLRNSSKSRRESIFRSQNKKRKSNTVRSQHSNNNCALTTNENMIYSSALFSPSINQQEYEKSLPILGNGHSATAQICTAAGGNKQKIYNGAVVSGNVCEGFTESSGCGDDSCDIISDSIADRGSSSSDGMHHLTAITTLGNSSISNTERDSNSAGNCVTSCSGVIRSGSSNENEICGGVGCEAEVVVLDFETTGLSSHKHRVIEVAAVILHGYKVVSSFQSLCNPQQRVPYFITKLTGISNEMLLGQPTTEAVMLKLQSFVGNRPIIAHNATFDSKFFFAELARARKTCLIPPSEGEEWRPNLFICTLKLSRRVLPGLHSHKLSALKHVVNFSVANYKEIVSTHKRGLSTYHHQDHRALDDVLVTVSLWFHLKKRLDILHNSPGPSAYIHQKLLHLKKKGSTCIVDTSHHTYTSRDQSVRVMNSKITFYALISSMTAQEVQKLLFM